MNKRKLYHLDKQLKPVKSWFLLVLSLVFLLIGVWGLRQNNLTAISLRDAVLTADKNSGNVELELRKLREFMYSHMNADLSSGGSIQQPIQLKYSYERLLNAEKARVEQTNAKIYTDAQAYCEQQFPKGLSGSGRIPCIQDYVTKNGATAQQIPDSLYKFDFVAPLWSPDLAGISLLISGIFFVLFVFRFFLGRSIKKNLEHHL